MANTWHSINLVQLQALCLQIPWQLCNLRWQLDCPGPDNSTKQRLIEVSHLYNQQQQQQRGERDKITWLCGWGHGTRWPTSTHAASGNRQEASGNNFRFHFSETRLATSCCCIQQQPTASSQQPLNGNCCLQHLHCDASNEILSAVAACATFVSASCAFWSSTKRGPKKAKPIHGQAPVCPVGACASGCYFWHSNTTCPGPDWIYTYIYILVYIYGNGTMTATRSQLRLAVVACTMLWHWHWQKCGNSQPAFICTSCRSCSCCCCSCIFGKCGHAAYTQRMFVQLADDSCCRR